MQQEPKLWPKKKKGQNSTNSYNRTIHLLYPKNTFL